jgi:hypothetical protein
VVLNLKKSQGQLYLLQRLIFMFRYLGLWQHEVTWLDTSPFGDPCCGP